YDADILCNARPSRQSIGERRDIGDAADRLNLFFLREFFGEGDDVHRSPGFHQVHDAAEETAMRIEVEILRLERLSRFVVSEVIEKNCSEDGLLSLDARWHPSFEI